MSQQPAHRETMSLLQAPHPSATIYCLYAAPPVLPDQVVFRINGYEGRVILVDEIAERSVERHRPNFYSQTDLMYNYVVRNPNRIITLDELRTAIDRRHLSLNFTKMVGGLKFTGKLRRLFFRASQSHLIFYNPITVTRMQMLDISYEDIIPYLMEKSYPTLKPHLLLPATHHHCAA